MKDALDKMDKSDNTYILDVGNLPESLGGGLNQDITPAPSFVDRLLGNTSTTTTNLLTVDPKTISSNKDVNGNTFIPTPDRVMIHEIGHSVRTGDAVIDFENKGAKELDKNAPARDKNDHGDIKTMFDAKKK